jgi:protein-arginine kinase activator protein McsA
MAEFEKPSNTEEEYFAREEIEKKRKLALQQADELAQAEKKRLQELHYLRCPKCGMKLQSVRQGPVEIESCFNCQGIWLDAGELEQLVKKKEDAHPVMEAILNWFKRK